MQITRDYEVDLKKLLPEFICIHEPENRIILDVESEEHKLSIATIEDLFDQLFVETATWGLTRWEKLLDLQPSPSDSYEQRRNRILLRLQKCRTSTVAAMEELASRYVSEETSVKIEEYARQYRFKLQLQDGYVKYWSDLRNALELYKPAHLAYWIEMWLRNEEDRVVLPDEEHLFEIFTHYADTIPYGRRGVSRYGRIQYGNFTYNRGINLDLDEVHLQMALEAADRYETLVRYGRIQYGQFKYGGKMALPLEDRPVINLSLLNAEKIETPTESFNWSTQLQLEDTYKHSLIYGRFKYGDKAAYGSQKARPMEEVPKICITTEFEEEVEVDESFELTVIRPSHYGRIKYGKFQYGGEILCEDVM